MAKYNLTTLTCFYFQTKAALDRALQREEKAGVYTDAQVFDLKKPLRVGVLTQFRSNIRDLHAVHGLPVARDGTMPGYMVLFFRQGTTMKLLADQGVFWDQLPESERDMTLLVVKQQRAMHLAALDEESGATHIFRTV